MLPPPAIRGVFRTDRPARAAYAEGAGIFRMLPAAVCVPADRQDVASVIHWAAAHGVSLVPRGAGSAMGGGNVGDGVILDLTAMPPRIELDAERRLAKTSTSVRLSGSTSRPMPPGSAFPPTRRAAHGPRGRVGIDQCGGRALGAIRKCPPLDRGRGAGYGRRRGGRAPSRRARARPRAGPLRGGGGATRFTPPRPTSPRDSLAHARTPPATPSITTWPPVILSIS